MFYKRCSGRLALIILLSLLTISCTNLITKESNEMGLANWIDVPATDLISEWGTPQNTYPLENSGKIIEYIKEKETLSPKDDCIIFPAIPFRHHFYDCPDRFPEKSIMMTKTRFFVDSNGIITRYQREVDTFKEDLRKWEF